MLQIKEWCDELGLKVKGVHATAGEKESDLKVYSSPNEYSRLAGVELIKNRVDLAHLLNAEAIVLHFVLGVQKEEDFRQELLLPVFKSFDELEPYCKTHKIRLCIENTGGTPAICCSVFDILCKRYDKDFFGLCLDTGHANIHCKENCLVYAERYNDRLFMIHVHDNQGEKDEHILPFAGTFDWEGFAKVLARSPYTLPILVESSTKEEGDDTAWLEKAFEAGNRISAMVEKHRLGSRE
jgi:sugar phosphate isomerase/epimerase